jgi:hypothetical protein
MPARTGSSTPPAERTRQAERTGSASTRPARPWPAGSSTSARQHLDDGQCRAGHRGLATLPQRPPTTRTRPGTDDGSGASHAGAPGPVRPRAERAQLLKGQAPNGQGGQAHATGATHAYLAGHGQRLDGRQAHHRRIEHAPPGLSAGSASTTARAPTTPTGQPTTRTGSSTAGRAPKHEHKPERASPTGQLSCAGSTQPKFCRSNAE